MIESGNGELNGSGMRVQEARRIAMSIPGLPPDQRLDALEELVALARDVSPEEGRPVVVNGAIVNLVLESLSKLQLIERWLRTNQELRRMTQERSIDIDDLTQVTLWEISRSLAQFRGESRFTTWAEKLFINVCRTYIRNESRRPPTAYGEFEVELEEPGGRFSSFAVSRFRFTQALQYLAPRHREFLILKVDEDRSPTDIQATLNISDGQYRNRQRAAFTQLRKAIEELD